jgi:hypothetical protein
MSGLKPKKFVYPLSIKRCISNDHMSTVYYKFYLSADNSERALYNYWPTHKYIYKFEDNRPALTENVQTLDDAKQIIYDDYTNWY